MLLKGRTKKFQGRRYELISWEALLEIEEAGGSEWFDRDWEQVVCEAIDEKDHYEYMDYDSPLEAEWMRVLHR